MTAFFTVELVNDTVKDEGQSLKLKDCPSDLRTVGAYAIAPIISGISQCKDIDILSCLLIMEHHHTLTLLIIQVTYLQFEGGQWQSLGYQHTPP